MATFDPKALLETALVGKNQIERFVLDSGEYHATIDKVDFSPLWKDGKGVHLVVTWDIQTTVPEGMNKVVVQQRVPVALTEDKQIDMSKYANARLGAFREHFGMNSDSEAFQWAMLLGQSSRVVVERRQYTNSSGQPDEISEVIALVA